MRDRIIGEITKEHRERRKEIEELQKIRVNILDKLKNENDALLYSEYVELEHRLEYITKNINNMVLVATGIDIAREIIFNI